MKKKLLKIGVPILIILLILYILFRFLLNTFYIRFINVSDNALDNAFNNSMTNYGANLVRAGDKIYYSYANHLWKDGTYEITNTVTRRVYWSGKAFSELTLACEYSYDGRLIGKNFDEDSKKTTLEYYNFDSGDYEYYADLECPQGEVVKDIFTINNSLYYNTSPETEGYTEVTRNLYKFTDDGYEIVAATEACGGEYIIVGEYKGYIYYYLYKPDDTSEIGHKLIDTLYKYDLTQKKIVEAIDISALKLYGIGEICILDDKILFDVGEENIVCFDITTHEYETIMSTDNPHRLIGYGKNAFISIENGDAEGLYSYNYETNSFEMIYKGYVRDVYIVDTEWVYFVADENVLYRIKPDGNKLQKVFG